MAPLVMTYVYRAVPECCKGNATGLEHLSCHSQWLIGEACLSSEYRSCEECDLCPVQHIEMFIDWFSAVMWGAIKMSNAPIDGTSEFSFPRESVYQEMCCAGIFSINRC